LEIVQILLAGPGGGLDQINEFFTQRLNLPAMQIDPVAALSLQIDEEKYPPVERPGLGIVLGLGMREA
jgi:type IV pilus assembly protein PilM